MSQSQDHESAKEALRKAEAYLRARDLDAARRMLDKSLRLHPGNEAAKRVRNAWEVQRVMSCDVRDYYKLLGVERDATAAAVNKSFKDKSKFVHPDKNTGNAHANEAFQRLEQARSTLGDGEKRRRYDAEYDRGRGKRRRPPTTGADPKRARPAARPSPDPYERQRAPPTGGGKTCGESSGAGYSSGGSARSPGVSRNAELDKLREDLKRLERKKVLGWPSDDHWMTA